MTPDELEEVVGTLGAGDRLFVRWRDNPFVYAVELIRPLRADHERVLHAFLIDPRTGEAAPYMLIAASNLAAASRTRDGIEGPSEPL